MLGVASMQAAPLNGNAPSNSSAFDVLQLPPSPMPPEPSPPPPPHPQPPEPSPPPPEPSLPPGYGHNHPVQQHSFPVEMMPYQIAVEEPTLAVQVLVSMSSLTAMLFLSLVTWQVLVNRTMARRCGLVHASHTHATRTRARPPFPSAAPQTHLGPGLGRRSPIAEARPVLQAVGTIPTGRRREEAEESEPMLGAASSLPPASDVVAHGVRVDRQDEAEQGIALQGLPPDPLAQEVREFALRLGAVEERLASSRQTA